ncbi:AAEL012594-PA, partial [Aedes aegypti]
QQEELDRNLGNEVPAKVAGETAPEAEKSRELQLELKRIRDEFNQQRAKMKELYLAKEAECKRFSKEAAAVRKELDEAKSQIMVMEYNREKDLEEQNRRAQEEIHTLQQLVQETVDESAFSNGEVRRLAEENERLRTEQQELKEALAAAQQDTPSLAPVLNQAKKIIRKLGAADSNSHDNLEDSMRKVNKYAQEDAEVLRSLVVPLEEEIKTLKEKLRDAYEELEKHPPKEPNPDNPQEPSTNNPSPCEMCSNYESKLVHCQEQINGEKQKVQQLEKSVERMKEELAKEGAMRADLEAQWQLKREDHKAEVQRLNEQTAKAEQELAALRKDYGQLKQTVNDELQKLTEEREQVTEAGGKRGFLFKYLQTTRTLTLTARLTVILLPLSRGTPRNMLCEGHADEVTLLRDQQHIREREVRRAERDYSNKVAQLEEQLRQQYQHYQRLAAHKEELERADADNKRQISELRMQTIELQATNEKLDKHNVDLKNKMSVLQEDLANNEAVQKDFVKLSQSLQMQLEKIRSADTQVRWQDEEDIDQCPNCRKEFTVTRRKQHCRHCGTIYCPPCLTKTVSMGTNRRPAHVCDVCHTLLVQDTAPYFSREPPQSP